MCAGDSLKKELNHLSRVFQANGYPHAITAGVFDKKRRAPPSTSTEDDEQKLLVLPYVKGLSKKVRLVCRPLNIKTAFRFSSTLRSLLTHVKAPTPPEEQKCVVYRVPCECGSVYVEETGRQMKTRMSHVNLPPLFILLCYSSCMVCFVPPFATEEGPFGAETFC